MDVFISYRRAQRDSVEPIKNRLEALGLRVFFDVHGIDGGADFPSVIDENLRASKAVLACWSPLYFKRNSQPKPGTDWCMVECRFGLRKGALVPIAIERFAQDAPPADLIPVNYFDLSAWRGQEQHEDWKRTLDALSKLVGKDLLSRDNRDFSSNAGGGAGSGSKLGTSGASPGRGSSTARSLFNVFAPKAEGELAIDLGTCNTRIYEKRRGLVLDEPSLVAYATEGGRKVVHAVGREAKSMFGKTHRIEVIRPFRDGAIVDFDVAEEMIKLFVKKVLPGPAPIALANIGVSTGASRVERRLMASAVQTTGARAIYAMDVSLAAAIGAGLKIDDPSGCMVVDIGGGTTEIAALAHGGVVWSRSLRVGGDKMDEAIIKYLRRTEQLLIGDLTAEHIKKEIGAAKAPDNGVGLALTIRGRDLLHGNAKEIELTEAMVAEALADPVSEIVDGVTQAFELMPPEIGAYIADRGIVLTGGGALLRNLDIVLKDRISVGFFIADDPLTAVVRGLARAMELNERRYFLDL